MATFEGSSIEVQMMMHRTRDSRLFKAMAMGLVCLFLFTTIFQGISYADISCLAPNHELYGYKTDEAVAKIVELKINSMMQEGKSPQDKEDVNTYKKT